MGVFAAAISVTLFLLFMEHPMSFCQEQTMTSHVLLEVSPETLSPDEGVSVKISTTLEPNSTASMAVWFVPPHESGQRYQLDIQTNSFGFATETIDYPSDIINSSNLRIGSYGVLVQDLETGSLLEKATFEVEAQEDFPSFISSIPSEIFFPAVAALIGGFLTYWYNSLSHKRETRVALNQKKAETFLVLRPHYSHVSRSLNQLAVFAENRINSQLANQLKVKVNETQAALALADERHSAEVSKQVKSKLEDLENQLGILENRLGKDHFASERVEMDYQWCFYHLIIYARERKALIDKFGAYFLSDPRGERFLAEVEKNILARLRSVLTPIGFDQLGSILTQEQTFSDLELELARYERAYHLYETFKNWINNNNPEKEIAQFIVDLKLYSNIMNYEIAKMFEQWYPKKVGIDQTLCELLLGIVPKLQEDERYRSLKLDYFEKKSKLKISMPHTSDLIDS